MNISLKPAHRLRFRLLLGAAFLLPSLALPLAAQPNPAVAATKVTVERKAFDRPLSVRVAGGELKSYSEGWEVRLRGTFPIYGDRAMELYVGDYRVPEYGGTADGLYFRLYDSKVVAGLAGREISWRFGREPLRPLGLRFPALATGGPVK
jgi:hypothetical protein